jgi:isopentenyl diphosphate isomerase/L-lactate dehydrogenase-like FMN-dependent dehydrogenase
MRPAAPRRIQNRGGKDWAATLDGWYGGARAFDWSNPRFNATAADFAQMVWTATTAVGCAAEAKCARGPLHLCYYSPAGNVIGVDWEKHVLPARA